MTDNRLAPLRDDYLPRDRQAALWAEIRTVIEMAGLTYKAAQVRPLSINSLTGADDWQIEVVWMPAGMRIAGPDDRAANWRRRIFIGENAAAITSGRTRRGTRRPAAIASRPGCANCYALTFAPRLQAMAIANGTPSSPTPVHARRRPEDERPGLRAD
jgi:hypothetical protein